MNVEQELHDAGRSFYADPMALGDYLLDEAKDSSSCAGCGATAPVRIEGQTCSECADFPRCWNCGRWVNDGSGWLPGYVHVLSDDGDVKVCLPCWNEVE